MIEDVEINDNEFLRPFELQVGDNMARIEYSLQERKIFLTKYFMPEDMEEQGFRDIFIKAVFQEVEDRNIRLVPTSPEIAAFMRKNRRIYKDLLPVGISITLACCLWLLVVRTSSRLPAGVLRSRGVLL